jgi:acyl-CoA thioester hydrolase
MLSSETKVRVRYGETDKMSYVYYGNYATYYEVGRVEWLREMGLNYKNMEESGIMLPVVKFEINYFKPAFYDDLLTIKTIVTELPSSKIKFDYECYNEHAELLNKGHTTLVFVDMKTGKATRAPEYLLEKLRPSFIN